MSEKYLVFMALGCLLSTSNLLVHSLPIKYLENQQNPQRENNNKFQAPQKPIEYADDAGHRPEAPENTVGLRLFPKIFEGGSTRLMHPTQRQSPVRLFPQIGKQDADAGTEMTVSVPLLVTDSKGNWVNNRWYATDGHVDSYTRLREFYRGPPPTDKFSGIKPYRQNYYPTPEYKDLNTVCNFRSTIYNVPRVYKWLIPKIAGGLILNRRGIWLDLRMVLYKDGNSLQCHTPKMKDWSKYIHCALMRNMRMEYLIPGYPRTQMSYLLAGYNSLQPFNSR